MTKAQTLDQKIRFITAREREALSELIVELKNLDSFKGYIELGYSSLFDYLTKRLSYSAGAAQRRIDAARLLKDVPELTGKLESGTLDLHHVTTVSKAVRQVQKIRKITTKEKCELIEKIEAKTEAQTQQAVAQHFNLPSIHETKKKTQRDHSVRIELTLSPELARQIEQAQGLVSHAVPTKDLVSFLDYVSKAIIKQKMKPPRSTTTMAVKVDSKVVPQRVHRVLRGEQPACKNCGSIWFLQTDHKKAKWLGGGNDQSNLQTLCGPCNRAKYEREKQELRALVI